MLPVVSPRTDVLGAVGPDKRALAVLLAVLEVPLVTAAVVPHLDPAALDRPQPEFTLIHLVHICKVVLAFALELAVDEFAFVVAAVSPFEAPAAVLLAFVEVSDVARAAAVVAPDLLAMAVLGVVQPFSSIAHALCRVVKDSLARRLVSLPLAHVDVLVGLHHFAPAREEAVSELTFVLGSIRVELSAGAVLLVSFQRPSA